MGLLEPTTRTEAVATTVGRTAVLLLGHLALESLAELSVVLISRPLFWQPANLMKYSGETNPELWLADYRLACQLGSTDDVLLIIRNLSLFLSDSA